MDDGFARYPGVERAALALAIAREHGVAERAVHVGAGATAILDELLALWRPATLAASAPGWPALPRLCARHGVSLRGVPLVLGAAAAAHDTAALAAANADAVFVDSPNNPSGCVVSLRELERLDRALSPGVPLVVDQTYLDYAGRPEPAEALLPGLQRPFAVLRSFSKVHRLAGLRVGYALAGEALVAALARRGLPHAVATPALVAACHALADRVGRARAIEHNRVERRRLLRFCDEHGLRALRSEACFLLVACAGEPRFFDGRFAQVPIGTAAENARWRADRAAERRLQ